VLKLGYKASAEQFGARELVEYAVLAEAAGFDSVVVSDHFQPWRHNGGHAPFCFSWMAAVGERTTRVELGTSVDADVPISPRYRGQAVGTLGVLYPGRVWLGVGTGESMNEVPVPVRNRIGQCRGGSTLGSIVHGPSSICATKM
jgi:coenzyme F420-dependent glucose-6-phosphate dehydrogenase